MVWEGGRKIVVVDELGGEMLRGEVLEFGEEGLSGMGGTLWWEGMRSCMLR